MITVGICTYRRPVYLEKLLTELSKQYCEKGFGYSVLVVDNDINRSAEDIVKKAGKSVAYDLRYMVESRKNISRVRNRIVKNCNEEFLAFIDDDEFPDSNWLHNLYTQCIKHEADGVLGPVVPFFDLTPPLWLVKSGICNRKAFVTGTLMNNPKYTRTGNVLFRMSVFGKENNPFDEKYGTTGGEDSRFFESAINRGAKFVWCNEAVVWEAVPVERFSRVYYLKRALLRGAMNAKKSKICSISTAKSLIASGIYTITLPFLQIAGHHYFMRYLVRNCDHIGKLLGLLRIEPVKKRSFEFN